jgi:membrane-bound lytic murein transglycosylase D
MRGKIIYILSGMLMGFLSLLFIFAMVETRNPDRDYRELFGRSTRILVPEVPAKATFCGEEVPLSLYYVHEAFERELMAGTFMHSSTVMMFKRSYRWFPVIEPILKKNGIPDDFKFLAVAESNLANVISPSGAEGFWQFLKPTGQQYGLEINDNIDERYNLEKATESACRYLKESYTQFGSWSLVAASFNRGQEGIEKALEKQQVKSYFDLYLNDETSRYLFRIIAIKEIYNHPVRYGFFLRERNLYSQVPTRLVVIDTAIHNLPSFALKMKINYRILRELNPWIQSYTLPNKSRKIYTFLFPKEGLGYDMLLKRIPQRDIFFHDTLKISEIH